MNKSWIIAGVVVILLIAGGWFAFNSDSLGGRADTVGDSDSSSDRVAAEPQVPEDSTKGRLVISVTDAAADMENVTAVKMRVDSIDVHSSAEGWVTIKDDSETYDLLELDKTGKAVLSASVDIDASAYDRVRFEVGKVEVETSSGDKFEANLPGKTFEVATKVEVKGGETSSLKIDVLATDSLHKADSESYVFAPVVIIEARSDAEVAVTSANEVLIQGGVISDTVRAGMDTDGSVKLNFMIDAAVNLDIGVDGIIKVNSETNGGVNLGL